MSADDNSRRQFLAAVQNSSYRNRRRTRQQPEEQQTPPANMSAEELRHYQLGRMLIEALNPVDPEPTWQALFKRSAHLAAEPFDTNDEQEPK